MPRGAVVRVVAWKRTYHDYCFVRVIEVRSSEQHVAAEAADGERRGFGDVEEKLVKARSHRAVQVHEIAARPELQLH